MATRAGTKQRSTDEARGLVCDGCGGRKWRVVYTRGRLDQVVQRRRECKGCGRRITTWERKTFQ